MTVIDNHKLAELGLLGVSPNKIAHSVTFEVPARLSNVGLLGHERIGALSYVGPESELKNCTIGRFCSIARNVALGPPEHPVDWTGSHPMQYNGLAWFKDFDTWHNFANTTAKWRGSGAGVTIGNDVWIGRNAVVRQGVTVGHGAIIGANSFVNRDVEPYAIVAGQPARLIRYRFADSQIEKLLSLQWWDWMPPEGEQYDYHQVNRFIETFEDYKQSGRLRHFTPVRRCVRRTNGVLGLEVANA